VIRVALDAMGGDHAPQAEVEGAIAALALLPEVVVQLVGKVEVIEAELAKQPSIAQIAVFGEARPWSTAVVVPAPGARRSDIQAEITAVNAALPDYARVGDWIAAREPFSPDNQQLTSNGRNRRDAIWHAYQAAINARYDEYVAIPSFVYEQRRSLRDFLRGTEIRDCRG